MTRIGAGIEFLAPPHNTYNGYNTKTLLLIVFYRSISKNNRKKVLYVLYVLWPILTRLKEGCSR